MSRRRRITPAGAGKTHLHAPLLLLPEDHPRRCGENIAGWEADMQAAGSPPQVRGKQGAVLDDFDNCGITPAGAGKTTDYDPYLHVTADHPRRCGENRKLSAYAQIGRGSPPQVRGKPETAPDGKSRMGITPAGAGKTKRCDNRAR